MLSHKPLEQFIRGFTLIELSVTIAVLAIVFTLGAGLSFSQYDQWMALTKRESVLDAFIKNRSLVTGTSTTTFTTSFGSFSEPVIVYENGELWY